MTTSFSQRDPRWAGVPLGHSELTLGQAGCLVSAVASAASDLGKPMDPSWLNLWLRKHGGFVGGDLVWGALEGLGVRLVSITACQDVPAPVDAMRAALAAGQAVVVEVDAAPGGPVEQHWVRLLAIDDDGRDAAIMDPWQEPGQELGRLSAHYEAPGWAVARAVMMVAILERVAPASGDSLRAALLAEAQEHQALQLNPGAALQKAIYDANYVPPVPGITPTPVPATGDLRETNDLLRELIDVLRAIGGHLGVQF